MKVVWFKRAIWDLESARHYIAEDNPRAAQQFVLKIKEMVALLSTQPGIGRSGRVPNTKELVMDHTPYVLPYRVRNNTIEILRVLHTSRQWPKRF